jgi:hypothetical protein
MAFIS